MERPVSLASFCSSTFHKRTREPLLTPHRLRLAFGAKRAARVFKIANIFFLFGVDRDGRLAIAPKLFDQRIDMLELGVTIRMLAALPRFRIRLPAKTHLAQQAPDNFIGDGVSLPAQGLGQMALALAHP